MEGEARTAASTASQDDDLAGARRGTVATVISPRSPEDWSRLSGRLANLVVDEAHGPIEHLLGIARHNDCQTIVVERDYVDLDWLSEYSAFWSERFWPQPPHAARVHFFSAPFDESVLTDLPAEVVDSYLGYFVFRPTILGGAGRAVLSPPQVRTDPLPPAEGVAEPTGLKEGIRLTNVVDRPSLFGHPLEVRGVPFCQQDGEFLRCAHAAAWICHYVAFHKRIIGRQKTATIARMTHPEGSKHRPLPSMGLTVEQIQGVFTGLGIPAFFYEVKDLPELPADLPQPKEMGREEYERRVLDERIARVVCKYLNSEFPVVIFTGAGHAFTLVGWRHAPGDFGGVELIACDDQVGPYEVIASPQLDGTRGPPEEGMEARGEWWGMMVPLPSPVFLTGEAAENRARQIVQPDIVELGESDTEREQSLFGRISEGLQELRGEIRVRSRLIEGRRYKAILTRQERDPRAIDMIRLAKLPQWVWVVEFQNDKARSIGEPCVEVEIVFDSTSHDDAPLALIVCTIDEVINVQLAPDEALETPEGAQAADGGELDEVAGSGSASASEVPDSEFDEDGDIWLAYLPGKRWRSLVSDPKVDGREYPTSPASHAATTSEPAVS